jgi:hypothetical protein
MIDVNTPSVGRWTLMLNNEDSRAGIGVPVAREVWEAMIHQGWIVEGEERDHHESF